MSERLTTERVRAIADEPPDVLTDTGMSGGISSILAARYLRHNLAADLLDAREQLAAQADELARLASERDAAVLRATALADAVRRERETHRALRLARTRYIRSQVGESEREEHDARQAHYEADEAARDATADLDALLAGAPPTDELARLRAIVEGRTVPPTDAEIAAHEAAGGWWLLHSLGLRPEQSDLSVLALGATRARRAAHAQLAKAHVERYRWFAMRDGRPTAWPVAGEGAG